jgi:DMSO/TMAO reductase YedYZ molybdopterin-dependent catalytic subunit
MKPDVTDRRAFLRAAGLSAASLALAACDSSGPARADSVLRQAQRLNERLERRLVRHTRLDRGAQGKSVAGDAFPSYYISEQVPVWDEAARGAWRLEVGGLVERPISLSFDDLIRRLPRTRQRVSHFCVEGWTAVAEFTGVQVRALADLVRPMPGAQCVDFRSFDDGYHESWDLESALHPQTLIVYAKESALLTPAYGAPARVHSPVKLGYKNTKYLTRVDFVPAPNGGYWSDAGYEWFGGT